ncbi:unnamed protein product [Mucor hiemalis]
MGALISRTKVASDDYEDILSKLDSDIQQKEIQLSNIRIKDRRVGLLWLLYSTILWIIYILYYLYAIQGKYEDLQTVLLFISPIVLGPLAKALKWIYVKRLSSIETSLTSLRKQQKLKVEELKKKTAYYTTKSLLERYDPTPEQKKVLDEQKKLLDKQKKELDKQKKTQIKVAPTNQQHEPQPQQPQQQQWYDKVVDALVGDSGPETKYALICTHCYAHNGLVLPQEVDEIQYTCPHCHQFNPSRKSRKLHPDGPVLPPMSPTLLPSKPIATDQDSTRQRNKITKEESNSD